MHLVAEGQLPERESMSGLLSEHLMGCEADSPTGCAVSVHFLKPARRMSFGKILMRRPVDSLKGMATLQAAAESGAE